MKAWFIARYGKARPLTLGDAAEPEPGPGEVLVAIEAAGLNQLDLKVRGGELKAVLPYKLPLIAGFDLAGIVLRTGAEAGPWRPGDAVIACAATTRPGTLTERIAIDHRLLAARPANIPAEDAAGLPLVALTAWQALVELGQMKPGQKVMIEAGSGGVGTIAIQLAKHLGLHVATTCRARNAELVRALGADEIIDYTTQDFSTVLRGYDMMLHSQGAGTLDRGLSILKPGGLLVSINGTPDLEFARDHGRNAVFRLAIRLISSRLRRKVRRMGLRYRFLFMRADGAQLTELARLFEQGALRPVTDRVVPFDQAAAAMDYLASGRARGKVVVKAA